VVPVVLLVLLLAVVLHHVLVTVYSEQLGRSIMASLSILDGRPHWRYFQSRLLGPIAITLFRDAAPVPDLGYVVFDLTGFGVALVLAWRMGRRVVGSTAGALATMLTMTVALVSLFKPNWFYSWDVLGLPIFMIFALLVNAGAKWTWIVLLFAVGIWNREDALFIALFLMSQPFIDWWWTRGNPTRPRFAWGQVAAGLTCFAGGMVLVMTLRRLLLVHETGPAMFGSQSSHMELFDWNLVSNFGYLWRAVGSMVVEMPGFAALPPVAVAISCVYLVHVSARRYLGYALINLAMVLATLMFGLVSEMRIWVDLLPPVVLATAVALARSDEPAVVQA
jgi:hypothetical protein